MTRHGHKSKGITVVETLISVFLVLLGILLGLSLYSASGLINRQASVRTVAYSVARQQLEQLRTYAASNRTAVSNASFPITDAILNNFPNGSKGLHMTGSYTISPVTGSTSRQQITVKVTWRNASSPNTATAPTSTVSISAIVAQEGAIGA